jgi:hypothetical protein
MWSINAANILHCETSAFVVVACIVELDAFLNLLSCSGQRFNPFSSRFSYNLFEYPVNDQRDYSSGNS